MNDVVAPTEEPRIQNYGNGSQEPQLSELEERSGSTDDLDEKIALWVQIGAEVDRGLAAGAEGEPELLSRMLLRAAQDWPGGAPKWLERVQRGIRDKRACLDVLLSALRADGVEPATAELLAKAAVDTAPDRKAVIEALEAYGDVLERQGASERAATQFREAAEHCAPDEVVESSRLLERARAKSPEDAKLELRLIDLYTRAGNFVALRLAVRRLGELEPNPATRCELLLSLEPHAISAGASEEYASMVDELLPELVSTDAARARALRGAKARVMLGTKRLDGAAALYEELIENYGDDEDVRAYVGLLELSPSAEWRREKRHWLFEWRAASAEDPVSVMMHWARVEEHEFDDAAAAVRTLERALEQSPDRAEILLALARLKLIQGDVATGLGLIGRLRGIEETEREQASELALARELATHEGRAEIALDLVRSVLEHSPLDAAARDLSIELVRVPAVGARACELCEQSIASLTPAERAPLLGRLLEASEGLVKRLESPGELAARRRVWLEQVLAADTAEDALGLIERAASGLGVDEAAWHSIESRALDRGDPTAAVRAYERALSGADDPVTVEWLAERLIRVVEQHLSDPRILTQGLLRALEVLPDARWAFDRVKLSLSLERRWNELFPLYDRAVAAEKNEANRALLLDEAAVTARDVAGDPERAIGYWEQYLAIRPRDHRVDTALERLYERQHELERLIEHLLRRGPGLGAPERARLYERVAGLKLELADPAGALEQLEKITPLGDTALDLLERVLGFEPAEGAARESSRRAARLLRASYLEKPRLGDATRVLGRELELVDDEAERRELLSELCRLCERQGDQRRHFEALGQLLLLEPDSVEHQRRLTELAAELGLTAELAAIEVRAAEKAGPARSAELLADAARIERELGNGERAIELELRILNEAEDAGAKLRAARALELAYTELGRDAARCDLLERIAALETDPEARRAALLEGARLALERLGAPARAAEAYRALLDERPGDPRLLDGWVRALAQTDRHSELVTALRARAEATTDPVLAREDLGSAARLSADRLGDHEGAIEAWRAIRARFGPDAESFEALSALFEAGGHFQELTALIGDEIAAGRAHGLMFTRLAEIHATHTRDLGAALAAYVRGGDLDRAADLLCETPSLLSDDPSSVLGFVDELVAGGRLARAERVLRRQLEHYGPRRPKESAAVYVALSDVLCEADRPDDALRELVLAAERHPSSPLVLSALGQLSSERGELSRAEQSYQALLMLIPHYPDAVEVTSRAEVYLALSELSRLRGEPDKADDQIEWAFEAALGNPREAEALERGLAERDLYSLLERAIRGRLERAVTLEERLAALSDLVMAAVRGGSLGESLEQEATALGQRLQAELLGRPELDRPAFDRLIDVYDALGKPALSLELLDSLLPRAPAAERFSIEIERARRMLALPERVGEGLDRLWELLKADAAHAEAAEVLAAVPAGRERLDELLSVLGDHASLAAAEGRAADARALRLRTARVLEAGGRAEDALHAYLTLAGDESCRVEARQRALSLLDTLEAPAAELADAVDALLANAEGSEVSPLAARLVALADELGDVEYLERGLERGFFAEPGRADLRERLLAILDQRGEWLRVRDVLERAIERAPEPELVLRLADAHLQTGAPDRALDLLETVGLRVAPERAVRRRRAATLEAAGRTEEALEELVELNKAYGDASDEIASAIRRTRIWTDSERWALLAMESSLASSDPEELNAIVEHWVERGAESPALLWQLGERSAQSGHHERAARVYRRLSEVEQAEQRYAALSALARAEEAAGDAAAAQRTLEAGLERAPEADELFYALSEIYARNAEHAKRGRLLVRRAALVDAGERRALLREAAELLSREGAAFDALDALSRLEALEPEQVESAVLRARVLRQLGRHDDARAHIRRFLEAESRPRARPLARLYRELGELHLATDELVEAYQALSSAHQIDRADSDTAWVFGVLAFDLDQFDAAAAALRAFLTLRDSGSAQSTEGRVAAAYYRLAWIEHGRGQPAIARRFAAQALHAQPSNTEAQRLVALLGAT